MKERQELLQAMNTYATKMNISESDEPIILREVRPDDVLIADFWDGEKFESGNTFAMTSDGEFVYGNVKVGRNLLFFYHIIKAKELDSAVQYHTAVKKKLEGEVKYLNEIQQQTNNVIKQLQATLKHA